jgi:hypothetical protein
MYPKGCPDEIPIGFWHLFHGCGFVQLNASTTKPPASQKRQIVTALDGECIAKSYASCLGDNAKLKLKCKKLVWQIKMTGRLKTA